MLLGKYESLDDVARKVGDDELVFLLRAQDILAPSAVEAYAAILAVAGQTATQTGGTDGPRLVKAAEDVRAFATRMRQWQVVHGAKLPD